MANFQTSSSQLCYLNYQEEKHKVLYPDLLGHATFLQNLYSMEHTLRNAILDISNSNLCYV